MKEKLIKSLKNGFLAYLSQFFIFIFLVVFTLKNDPFFYEYKPLLSIIYKVILSLFVIEYFLRLWLSSKKYCFSFYGIIDFLAIFPSLLFSGIDISFLRILNFLRIFKVIKSKSMNNALKHLKLAFLDVKNELLVFTVISIILLYISSVGIHFFEQNVQPEKFGTIFDCLWWSVITLTTVGYGDAYPITIGGKFFTIFIVYIGLAIIAIPTGLFAFSFYKLFDKSKK